MLGDAVTVGLVGDRDPSSSTHAATESSLEHAALALGLRLHVRWLPTRSLPLPLEGFDALWCAPGSPYQSMAGALTAIRFARERGRPFLGTCGGFHHALLEYARNGLGITAADHEETSPGATVPLITRLECAIAGQRQAVRLVAGTSTARAYGDRAEAQEEFRCGFGLNPRCRDDVLRAPLHVAAVDHGGEIRAVELAGHPFFVATLFVPQLSSTADAPHPLVVALLRAARGLRDTRPRCSTRGPAE